MRKRTTERLNVVLNAAAEVFCEVGYERASMDVIGARANLSKATVYGYFDSKEELFSRAMFGRSTETYEDVSKLLHSPDEDIEDVLLKFGMSYTKAVSSENTLSFLRTTIAIGKSQAPVAARMYEEGSKKFWTEVAGFFSEQIELGIFRDVDPRILAIHLKGLLEAGVIEPLLHSKRPWFGIEQSVSNAIDAFLRAYRVKPKHTVRKR